ncbi:hypothetical protein C1T31_08030 [Hanstruepera neustonica]|uniref:DUF3124 domain-containing protein n=1 Tax=Hanstruepera neustonica TaxID=1445657 RepID=A0A2K1DZJ0_9FLAO|nr:DUF3124 domain-containing protein [Hanstruepera neustonica]PNQ73447.1 hypothetical protein C1T31_08030 [Hanstruepera neustonica]
MKHLFIIILIPICFWSCEKDKEISSINPVNWEKRRVTAPINDSLKNGQSYLPVYSEIYSESEHLTVNLTATVSLRNINPHESIYLKKASYYDTKGNLIRTYFDFPIDIKPLETIEIVIDERDTTGGPGANFVFDWATKADLHEPFFEAVMISTIGQLGISFTTQGIAIN